MEELQRTRMPDGEIKMMSQPKQSPLLGQIVHFKPGDPTKVKNGADTYVAIIGQVFVDPGNPNPYCNLFVMPPFSEPYWEGSVQEGEGPRTYARPAHP